MNDTSQPVVGLAEKRPQCSHAGCRRVATWGVYGWMPGDTTVNLKRPVATVCGPHKPIQRHGTYNRNVRLP